MIDRPAREELISLIENFLDGKIMAFAFDDRLQEIETLDETAKWVIREAWLYYDDCRDHEQHLNKEQWDYFQRLLLLLASDAEVCLEKSEPAASLPMILSGGILAIIAVVMIPISWPLILWGCLFSSVAAGGIQRRMMRHAEQSTASDVALIPFSSLADLRHLRRQVPQFTKKRFRRSSTTEANRSSGRPILLTAILWFSCSPLILLLQVLRPGERAVVFLAEP